MLRRRNYATRTARHNHFRECFEEGGLCRKDVLWLPKMPEPAFAVFRDDVLQTLRGVAPVRLYCPLRAIWITSRDRSHDDIVLLDRRRQLFQQHVDIQPSVALALRLDGAMKRQQPRSNDVLDVRAVKLEVELERTRVVPALARGDRELAVHL